MTFDRDFWRIIGLRTLGNFLILASFLMLGKTFGPVIFQEAVYSFRQFRGVKTIVVAKTAPEAPNAFLALIDKFNTTEEILAPPDPQFSIIIPKIAAVSRVVANVDNDGVELGRVNEFCQALAE